jgi:DNA-binding transcriptional LysR family regulator
MSDMQSRDRIERRIKLHDLDVLIAVVQAGSMSKAAQFLNTTQPSISRSIADLEDAIGFRLLDRGRYGAEPTEYGRALLDGGVAMFDHLRQAVKRVEFIANPTVGEVRIGAHDPIVAGVLPAVLDRLGRKHPGISVQVTPITASPQQFRELRERKLDLFLGRMTLLEDDIQGETLFHDRIFVVAGPRSKWARRRKLALSDLDGEPWVIPRYDSTIGQEVANAFHAGGAKFPPKGVVWGPASLGCALLPRGRAIGTLPASLLRLGVNLPRHRVLPVDLLIPPWPIGIMTLKNRTLSPVVQLFIDCAREVVKPLVSKHKTSI